MVATAWEKALVKGIANKLAPYKGEPSLRDTSAAALIVRDLDLRHGLGKMLERVLDEASLGEPEVTPPEYLALMKRFWEGVGVRDVPGSEDVARTRAGLMARARSAWLRLPPADHAYVAALAHEVGKAPKRVWKTVVW